MNYLNEYDDSELGDLLGDLSSIGLETPRGTVIFWFSEYDVPRVELLVSSHPAQTLALYLKNGFFGPDLVKAISSKYPDMRKSSLLDFIKGNDKVSTDMGDWFGYLEKNGKKISRWFIVKDLVPQQSIRSPYYLRYANCLNPYLVVEALKEHFTNIEEKLKSRGPSPRKESQSDSTDW